MTGARNSIALSTRSRHHVALHLAYRWFAYFESPGGDLDAHLEMFHTQVRLSGNQGGHLFARDRESLKMWLAAVPDGISSHHILHSNYSTADDREGLLDMVVAYQSPQDQRMHGSIISYQTRIEFTVGAARFTALDKTPILPNTKLEFETSWSTNRVLGRVHAELAGITGSDGQLRAALGDEVRQVHAHVTAPEGSRTYEAIVTTSGSLDNEIRQARLWFADNGRAALPVIAAIQPLAPK